MPTLESLGWGPAWASAFSSLPLEDVVPARVVEEQRTCFRIAAEAGEATAVAAGRLRRGDPDGDGAPVVGDWVAAHAPPGGGAAAIRGVLPRRSALARRDAGGGGHRAQVLAANVDTVVVVAAAGEDFNPRRIERTVALAWESGAQPVVLVSKADLAEDGDALAEEAARAAPGVPVVCVSAVTGLGVDAFRGLLRPGSTAVLVGSSGAGKSTLLNRLLGVEAQDTGPVRVDDERGRHTTTARHLFALPTGALVIDTPGLREVGLWDADEGVRATFEDVEGLARLCRFRDCRHAGEPACAVAAAVLDGTLAAERLAAWRKLVRELAFQARKDDRRLAAAHRDRWKAIHKAARRQRQAEERGGG